MRKIIDVEGWYNLSSWSVLPTVIVSRYRSGHGMVSDMEVLFLCVTIRISSKPKQLK